MPKLLFKLPRYLIFIIMNLCLSSIFISTSYAQDFPKGPVKIIIPFSPGGPTDTVGRLIAQKLQEIWGQAVIIDYKPGAGTMIGVDAVAKSTADGTTIGMVNSSFGINPWLHKSMPYNTLKDLSPVTQLANLQLAIVAKPDAPFNNISELIAYAKKNPGKLTYGTPGAGSTTHLGGELLQRSAKFEMLHLPFKGSSLAHTELMGGRIDLVIDPFLSVIPYVQAGKMKMIATLGPKRVPGYEKLYPTVAESIPGFNVNALLGFVVANGTPQDVINKIQTDTAKVLVNPEIKKRIEDLGMDVIASKPNQFSDFIHADMAKWEKIIKNANITVE